MTMRLKEIRIYGYGKFEDYALTNIRPFQVIYGENEAGKSTILSFIQSVLFGFPPVRQTNECRYEPKTGAKYGGALVLEVPGKGEVRIERIRGKSQGDVTVLFEDGTRGGEEALAELLSGIDKPLFQSVYFFNIHHLENMHKISGDDLGRFLFSTGAVGSDRILEAEKFLEREAEKWFKPSGKKPLINERIIDLQGTEEKLKEAKGFVQSYQTLCRRREETGEKIRRLRDEMMKIEEERLKKKEWNSFVPLLRERKELKENLREIGEVPFPEDGLSRLERLEVRLKAAEGQAERLRERMDRVRSELEGTEPDPFFLEHEAQIVYVYESLPVYRQLAERERELKFQLDGLDREEEGLLEGLHLPKDFPVSRWQIDLALKKRVETYTQRRHFLQMKKRELEQKREDLADKRDEKRLLIDRLKQRQLPADRKRELERWAGEETPFLEREYRWTEEQLNRLKNKKRTRIFQLAAVLSLSALAALLFAGKNPWYSAFAILPALILLLLALPEGKRDLSERRRWEKRKAELEARLGGFRGNEERILQAKEALEREKELEQQIQREEIRLEQLENQLLETEESLLQWKREMEENWQEGKAIMKALYLPEHLAGHLTEAFRTVERLKEIRAQKDRFADELGEVRGRLEQMEAELKTLAEKGSPLFYRDYVGTAVSLRQALNRELEKRREYAEKRRKLAELAEQLEDLAKEKEAAEKERTALFREAGTEGKEDFIRRGKLAETRKKWEERLKDIESRLEPLKAAEDLERIHDIPYYSEAFFAGLEEKRDGLKRELEQLEKERAALDHQIGVIENGGTFHERLAEFHQKKYLLREDVKKWAVYRVAADLLQAAMKRFKEENLPEVLRAASRNFSILTGGKYTQIFPDGDQLAVLRADGIPFFPHELSQATKEQLFIAIRFAVSDWNRSRRIPLFIDDSFVHFDENRLNHLMGLLREMEKRHQILFFTCHKHLLSFFEKEKIFHLK
ncbi:MAG: hypothetical protein CW346_03460 [Bacillaceae bacterium]|nr:hypothetical protein [Bacillaceae bacterium]